MKNRRTRMVLLAALAVFLLLAFYVAGTYLEVRYEVFTRLLLSSPPSWRGIVPGQTSEPEVVRLLGAPSVLEHRYDYTVYVYTQPGILGWQHVELWFNQRETRSVVVGLLRISPTPSADVRRLEDLGLRPEHPERIYTSLGRYYRYLVWARHGVAAVISAEDRASPWSLPVEEVLLIEPMTARQAIATSWPWPSYPAAGWSGDWLPPGSLPLDPYEW